MNQNSSEKIVKSANTYHQITGEGLCELELGMEFLKFFPRPFVSWLLGDVHMMMGD